jgi:alpha-galactosidase
MMSSPLIIGCDIRNMSEKTKEMLMNPELIAINQDPECRGCYRLPTYGSPDAFVLLKQLTGNEWAVGFFNFGDSSAHVELHFWDMGLPLGSGMGLHFHDCLTHKDLGVRTESYSEKVVAHGCRMYRVNLENA